MNKYANYYNIGTFSLLKFCEFVIKRRKGIDSKRRKTLLTKLKKYSKMEHDYRRKRFMEMAGVLGGQKTFNSYMEYRKKHKML